MKTLRNVFTLLLLCSLFSVSAQITGINYQMKFNESTCKYDCFMVVKEGQAETTAQRRQFNASFCVLSSKESSITVTNSYNPKRTNGQAAPWTVGVETLSPSENPERNYYLIKPALSPTAYHDSIYTDDTVHLFSISVTEEIYGNNGTRLISNYDDITSVAGSDYSNGFTMGGINELYIDNEEQVYPETYALINGASNILEDSSVDISPSSSSSWTSNNTSIATINPQGNTVTGATAGTAILTYTPSSGCISKAAINVIDASTLAQDRVGINTDTPDLSAVLDIVSTDKGVLLPRMSENQRKSIASPANGLLVFQNTGSEGLYYYNGNAWNKITASSESNTNIIDSQSDQNSNLRSSNSNTDLHKLQEKIKALESIVEKLSTLSSSSKSN